MERVVLNALGKNCGFRRLISALLGELTGIVEEKTIRVAGLQRAVESARKHIQVGL